MEHKRQIRQFTEALLVSLIYLSNTRPGIVHIVSLDSRFMNEPSRKHFEEAKRILRYIQGTKRYGIRYTSEEENKLVRYTDSDQAGSVNDRKSTSGYILKPEDNSIITTAEAKYISTTTAARTAAWIRRILGSTIL